MLHSRDSLAALVTDSWVPEKLQPAVSKISKSLSLRHHSGIPDDMVKAATLRRVALDVTMKARRLNLWDQIIRRNNWFQSWAAKQVAKSDAGTCFSYSYTALEPFQAAKKKGMRCVLGQIDPGPIEEKIVAAQTADYADLAPAEDSPPPAYWEAWRKEVDLADLIIVNSPWSADLLIRQDVPASKIEILPLAYEGKAGNAAPLPEKAAPERVTVLFLGQVILRKGAGQLFDAIRLLQGQPFRFIFAGPVGMTIPDDISRNPDVEILGRVDRTHAVRLYETSDVFILPTLSDGFAITQLEALAHGLPVIASKACGRVVEHGVNGLLLDSVTGEEIARRLTDLRNPGTLRSYSDNARLPDEFTFPVLAGKLIDPGTA